MSKTKAHKKRAMDVGHSNNPPQIIVRPVYKQNA